MKFKGTKGKWEVRPTGALNEDGLPLFYDITVNKSSFISTHKNLYLGMSNEQQEANAKLIAAAPEMFEMLKRSIDEIIHLKATYKDVGHCSKYIFETEQLLTKITE